MKKLVLSLVLTASLAIVPSAFALKAMTADNMKDTTGQAGVTIAADDIIIYSSAGTTTYTDNKTAIEVGLDVGYGDASLSIQQIDGTLTTIRAIFDNTDRGGYLKENYYDILVAAEMNNITKLVDGSANTKFTQAYAAALDANSYGLVGRPITIDVSDELATLSAAYRFKLTGSAGNDADLAPGANPLAAALVTGDPAYAQNIGTGVVGVRIGLPTMEIAKTGTTKVYSADANGGVQSSLNSGRDYIQITKSDTYTAILGGVVEIAPH